jgi:cytochrome c oxidase subunit III
MSSQEIAERWHLREIGLWMFLGTLVMLFAAFTSALVVRRSGTDWRGVDLPPILWVNTLVLMASSVALESARRKGLLAPRAASRGVSLTCGLALTFFVGQVVAWRQLVRAGVFLPSNPASSFFYILTGLHGLHLLAAFGFLLYLLLKTMRGRDSEQWPYLANMVATFWHFLGGVWVYLMIVLRLS